MIYFLTNIIINKMLLVNVNLNKLYINYFKLCNELLFRRLRYSPSQRWEPDATFA